MRKLTAVIICVLLFAGYQLQAATLDKSPKPQSPDKPVSIKIDDKEIITGNIDEPLALDMLKAYRKLKTYHTTWEMVPLANQTNLKQKLQMETAYDKKTGSCMYKMRVYELKDEKWQLLPFDKMSGTYLVVYRPNVLKIAYKMGAEPGVKVTEFDDNKKFTYRDFRRSIMPFQPFDLPLMISEMPFHAILQANPDNAKETTSKKEKPKVRTLELFPEGGPTATAAKLVVDNNKLLINRFSFFRPEKNQTYMEMKRVGLTINKPFEANIFDFEKQLASFKTQKNLEKASLPAN